MSSFFKIMNYNKFTIREWFKNMYNISLVPKIKDVKVKKTYANCGM